MAAARISPEDAEVFRRHDYDPKDMSEVARSAFLAMVANEQTATGDPHQADDGATEASKPVDLASNGQEPPVDEAQPDPEPDAPTAGPKLEAEDPNRVAGVSAAGRRAYRGSVRLIAPNDGWFKLYRKLLDTPIWRQCAPAVGKVQVTFLARANFMPGSWYCPHRDKGIGYTKCSCPIWVYGEDAEGRTVRESMQSRDWARANRRLAKRETGAKAKPISEAVAAFVEYCSYLEPSTLRKYRNVLKQLADFCKGAAAHDVSDITVELLDRYRAGRKLSKTTATKELQTLRQFFAFCLERKWTEENPAKRIKAPSNIKPEPIEPYQQEEIIRIIGACETMGRYDYERLRARAMVLLLRYTGLRISDVATLARDRVSDGKILVRTQKTGGLVYLPVPMDLQWALEVLPAPRGAEGEPKHFFWNGITSRRSVVGIAERTLAAVFKKSAVPKAHAHRFRHTLATEILSNGGTEQEAADVLGISPHIVRKHYAKWSTGRQERISRLYSRLFPCTNPVQTKQKGCNSLESQPLKWCGEGDLNPHEIAPASTSS
jgi:site-specific recombinase XerD